MKEPKTDDGRAQRGVDLGTTKHQLLEDISSAIRTEAARIAKIPATLKNEGDYTKEKGFVHPDDVDYDDDE